MSRSRPLLGQRIGGFARVLLGQRAYIILPAPPSLLIFFWQRSVLIELTTRAHCAHACNCTPTAYQHILWSSFGCCAAQIPYPSPVSARPLHATSSVQLPARSQTRTGDAGPIKALATTKCVAAAIENVLLAAHARNKEQWVYENAVAEKDAAISQFHSAHTTQCLLKDAVSKAEKAEAEAKTVIATYEANKVKPDEVTWLWAKKDAAWAKQDKEAVKAKLKWHSKCVVVPAKAAVRAAKAALAQKPIAKYLAAEEAEAKAAAHAKAMAKTSAAAAKARAATKAAKAAEAGVEQAAETLRKAVKTARKAAKVEEAKAKVKAAAEAKVKAAVEAKVVEAAMAVVEGAKAVAAKAAAEAAADEVVSADAQAKLWADAASKSTYAQVLIPNPANCFDTTWTAVKAVVDKAVTSQGGSGKGRGGGADACRGTRCRAPGGGQGGGRVEGKRRDQGGGREGEGQAGEGGGLHQEGGACLPWRDGGVGQRQGQRQGGGQGGAEGRVPGEEGVKKRRGTPRRPQPETPRSRPH